MWAGTGGVENPSVLEADENPCQTPTTSSKDSRLQTRIVPHPEGTVKEWWWKTGSLELQALPPGENPRTGKIQEDLGSKNPATILSQVTSACVCACFRATLMTERLCRTRLRRLMVIEANRIFKLKRAVVMLETCALRLQQRWLKHRYPYGIPKYRHRRDEAAMLFQKAWRGYLGKKAFKAALRQAQKLEAMVSCTPFVTF
jgi:hypothetical protein